MIFPKTVYIYIIYNIYIYIFHIGIILEDKLNKIIINHLEFIIDIRQFFFTIRCYFIQSI
jgi:hypothetical protein